MIEVKCKVSHWEKCAFMIALVLNWGLCLNKKICISYIQCKLLNDGFSNPIGQEWWLAFYLPTYKIWWRPYMTVYALWLTRLPYLPYINNVSCMLHLCVIDMLYICWTVCTNFLCCNFQVQRIWAKRNQTFVNINFFFSD